MIELLVLIVAWTVLCVFLARRGTKHLLRPHLAVTLPALSGLLAAMLEALPFEPLSPGFTLRTLIAVLGGVFGGRLLWRVLVHWARGHEKLAAPTPPRLVHPLIAAGLVLAAPPVLWHVITSNHALIEEQISPRDPKTGILHHCEEVRIEKPGDAAVLIVHGLYGSPDEVAELPGLLEARGLAVHVPLLPGHGHFPDDLDAVWSEDFLKAVRAAYDALLVNHPGVVVVGRSSGATLALLVAAERKPAALVLVNPYLGHLATPSWSPVAFDRALRPLSRVVRRVICDRGERGYRTQSLHALREFADMAQGADEAASRVDCPVVVLVGEREDVVEPSWTQAWTSSHLPAAHVEVLSGSGHDLYHDAARKTALERTVAVVAASLVK